MRFEKLLLAAAALCLVCMTPACSDDDPATDPEQNETPGTPGEGEGDGDDDSGEPGEPDTPDTPALTEGVRAEGYYKGDYHDEGTGNYWINFTVEDENDPGGYYILCLDFNGSLAADPDFAALDVRDYPMNVGVAIRPERSTATATPIWRATTTRAISPIPRRRAVRPRSR